MPRGLPLALAALILPLVSLALGATPAAASCMMPVPLPTAVSSAAAAFVGTVTATDWGGRRATVQVEDVWSGQVASPATVLGTPGGEREQTSVDRHYRTGGRYLFLPYAQQAGSWQDNACTRTQEYDPSLAALRPAGSHRSATTEATPAPLRQAPAPSRSSGRRGAEQAAIAAALASLAVVGLAVLRGRRARRGRELGD